MPSGSGIPRQDTAARRNLDAAQKKDIFFLEEGEGTGTGRSKKSFCVGPARRMAWRESVVWMLVVAMSTVQLTGFRWRTAHAEDNFPCFTTTLEGSERVGCARCPDAACGNWSSIDDYPHCKPSGKGFFDCSPAAGVYKAGFRGRCKTTYSYLPIAICFGSGAFAAGRLALPGCVARCAPTLLPPVPPGSYLACLAACVGIPALIGGGSGFAICCSQSCFCIDSCTIDDANREPVTPCRVQLLFPGCPGQ